MSADHCWPDAPPGRLATFGDAKRRARVHIRSLDRDGTLTRIAPKSLRTRVRLDSGRHVDTTPDDCEVIA